MKGVAVRLTLSLLLFRPCISQLVEQYEEETGGEIFLTEGIAIPSERPGYTVVLPHEEKIRGLIVFFNADRDTTNKLFHFAIPKRIAVAFVTTGNRLEFFFDTSRMLQIEEYLHTIITGHSIPSNNLMFVGMSLAGTRAAKFTVFEASGESRYHLVPKALTLCDAPLDFVRFWEEMEKAKKVLATPVTANEGTWVTGYLERNLEGTPDEVREKYTEYSPYSHSTLDTLRLRQFLPVRIRAYTEPDVAWWMETRHKDYYAMNAIDLAAFVNDLRIAGSQHAELILTEKKGYHPDGTRHPHSWSIVDEEELVDWFADGLGE